MFISAAMRPMIRLGSHVSLPRPSVSARLIKPGAATISRALHASPAASLKQMPPRPKPPPEEEFEESFLKGSGPGGQKINKTNSAVQLRHLPTGLVVKCQATRSREQNRKTARELLAQKLDDLRRGDESRAAVVGEVKRRRSASAAKKSRRKYRALAEEKGQLAGSEARSSVDSLRDNAPGDELVQDSPSNQDARK